MNGAVMNIPDQGEVRIAEANGYVTIYWEAEGKTNGVVMPTVVANAIGTRKPGVISTVTQVVKKVTGK